MTPLAPGLHGDAKRTVTAELTAEGMGSGSVPVLGTPALLAMMEDAAVSAVAPHLGEDSTSVGTWAELEHLAASKVGAEVRATAELVAVEGRRLEFTCEAFEGDKLIGRARHARAVVNRKQFLDRL